MFHSIKKEKSLVENTVTASYCRLTNRDLTPATQAHNNHPKLSHRSVDFSHKIFFIWQLAISLQPITCFCSTRKEILHIYSVCRKP